MMPASVRTGAMATAPICDEWIDVPTAAALMGIGERAVQLQAEKWAARGLARKDSEGWRISRAADSRLHPPEYLNCRDLEQLAGASSQFRPQDIEATKARKRVAVEWPRFPKCPSVRIAFARFIAALLADDRFRKSIGDPPSMKTAYRWVADYKRGGIEALIPKFTNRGRDKSAVTGQEALSAIANLMLGGNGLKFTAALLTVKGMALEHPGDPEWAIHSESITRRDLAPMIPPIVRTLANKGERAARAAHVPKMQRDFESIAAGEEYVGDERHLDLWVRVRDRSGNWDSVRPWMTALMDVRSRAIVAYILADHADSRTINACTKLAIRKHGKPRILRFDRGRDYGRSAKHGELKSGSDRLPGIMSDLGIEVRKVEAYTPWAKPIESLFKTTKEFDRLQPSFSGGCPDERHEDLTNWLKENCHNLPTLEELADVQEKAIEVYHNTPHGAPDMYGKTPLEALAAFRAEPIRRESDEVLDHLFAEHVGPKLVYRDGIKHEGRLYGNGDPRLVSMQGKRVILSIQPDDAGRATVCDLNKLPLFAVECLSLRGKSIHEAKAVQRDRRKLLRPYKDQVKLAKKFCDGLSPAAQLDYRLTALRHERGETPAPESSQPSQLRIRPVMEDAIKTAGPAPSDMIDDASMGLRSGTDDVPVTADDVLDDEREFAFADAPRMSVEDILGDD